MAADMRMSVQRRGDVVSLTADQVKLSQVGQFANSSMNLGA